MGQAARRPTSRKPPRPARAARIRARRRATLALALVAILAVALMLARRAPAGAMALDPAAFAPGACLAYPPTSGDRHQTVFLDAGHGGLDPGAVGVTEAGRQIEEATLTLPVELDAARLLRAHGFQVVVSRTGPSTVLRLGPGDVSGRLLTLRGAHDDVAARDRCANMARAAALVGIYFDAGGTAQDAGSITAYDADRPFRAANLRLANLLQHDVLTVLDGHGWRVPDVGVQTDTSLGSLSGNPAGGGIAAQAAAYHHLMLIGPAAPDFFDSPSRMPGAVIEPLFITDPFEGSIAASAQGQQAIAAGIATAVEQFLAPRRRS